MSLLYDHKGDPIDFSASPASATDLSTEFATRLTAGANFSAFLGWLPDPDPVLLKRADSADVLDDLTADDQVCMAMQNRKLRVLNQQDYDFAPGQAKGRDAAPEAAKLCDALVADLEAINLRNVFASMLDAPFYGFTPLELLWEPRGGTFHLRDIVAKPREWFAFDDLGRPVFRGETLAASQLLPPGKFVFVRHFPTYKNPYGLRLLSRCLWPVAFKRGGIEFLTRFLEKFGMPWVLAKSPRGADRAERMRMAGDLAAMVQDAVAVLPAGAEVEISSAQGKGGDQHEAYIRRWDKAISKVLMGQTLTAEMDGSGSRAASETHYSVSGDMAEADQFLVASVMNDIAIIYRDVNAGPGVLAPVFAYSEPEDYAAQADLDTKLHGVGVRFQKSHFTRRYGLAEDEFELEGGDAGNGADAAEHSEFAEPDENEKDGEDAKAGASQALVDQAIEDLLPEAVKANSKLVKQIENAVCQAETWEDMQLLLAELLGHDAEQDELEELLARIMLNAAAFGAHAVEADA
jgi:Mu-like prophage protein gp29